MKRAKQFQFWSYLCAIVLLGLSLGGCGQNKNAAQAAEGKPLSTYFPIKLGIQVVQLQVAALEPEMAMGLMYRRDLKPDQGMLFIYPKAQRMDFYMRNTPTPLDIGFFTSDGVLREKYPMYPFDEKTVSSRSDRIQLSVEMNQGWYDQNGVKVGAQLDMKALIEALKARGFEPRKYGLEKAED